MGHQPSQRAHQAHGRICRRTRHHCGGGGGGNPHSSGLDSSRKAAGQNPQWDRSPVFRLLGPSRFVPDKMFSLFFLLACSPVAVVCVSLTCVVLEVTSYPPVVSVSQFRRARVRRSLARSAISRSHPPTHPRRPPALSALTRRQACSPAWGGVPLFPPAFRSTLVGTRR